MRIDVSKLLFIGLEKDKQAFFKSAQRVGLVEFIGPALQASPELAEIMHALKILRGLTVIEQLHIKDLSKALPIARSIVSTKQKIERLLEQIKVIEIEISRIRPFGRFSFEKLHDFDLVAQFFVSKVADRAEFLPLEGLFHINTDGSRDYWLSLQSSKRLTLKLTEVQFEKDRAALDVDLADAKEHLRLLEQDLRLAAQYTKFLQHALLSMNNSHTLHGTIDYAQSELEGQLFVATGWAPKTRVEEVALVAAAFAVTVEEVAIETRDRVPTYLENTGTARLGQDLVGIYDTPSTNDKDPSAWVFWFFSFFFAMIINDAGYGLLFLGLVFWARKKLPKTPFALRMVKMGAILSVACIIWGTLTTSFFGIEIAPDNPLRAVSLIDWAVDKKASYHWNLQDGVIKALVAEHPELGTAASAADLVRFKVVQNQFYLAIMFEFALFVGLIHVALSMLRTITTNWAQSGWLLFMIGAYLYFPVMLNATSMLSIVGGFDELKWAMIGKEMVWVGLSVAVTLAIIQRRLMGILEIMNVIQIFCDVLSYLRLYALGLAGMMMASTFNDLAASFDPFIGVLILIAGHTVNMTMAIMGGVIHGLRLNFLEWYHYSFEGGGKLFKPLHIIRQE